MASSRLHLHNIYILFSISYLQSEAAVNRIPSLYGVAVSGNGLYMVQMHNINRNEALWNQKFQLPKSLLNFASSFLLQWVSAQGSVGPEVFSTVEDGAVCWTKPPPDWLKCNCDGATFAQSNKISFGWVVRDSFGVMVASGSGAVDGSDPDMAEALGCKEALSWLKAQAACRVIMEMDSLNLVLALRQQVSFPSLLGDVIDECKQILQDIEDSRVCFVRRSGNSVAHVLARASISMSDVHIWEGYPPQFICNALSLDI